MDDQSKAKQKKDDANKNIAFLNINEILNKYK